MDHNQTVTDTFLKKHLATEPRIIAAELYEAIKGQLQPALELAEFRLAIKGWFDKELSAYESVKGRFGGIRLRSEESRIAGEYKPVIKASNSPNIGLEDSDSTEEPDENEGLTIYITPSMRLYQPDSRNWAVQKRVGEGNAVVWVSQYYQNSLDAIISSYIRHTLNGEFKASPSKIQELKELVKVVQSVKSSLEESFKAIIVEKTGSDKAGEQAA